MDRTPLFHAQGKQTRSFDYYRNFWCLHYDRCLNRAAREDLFLDCAQCPYKDSVVDDFIRLIKESN